MTTTFRLRTQALPLAVLLLAILLTGAGCASTSHVMISPARPAISPDQVHVYSQPPPGRYVEIAILDTASGPFTYGAQNKSNAVITKLRAEAAKLGANGVLLQGTSSGPGGNRVGVGIGGGSYRGHTSVGGGVGVDISPTQVYGRGVAILVEEQASPSN